MATPTIEVVSFGYLHGAPPAAHLTIDLRTHFRDPHVTPALRYMTAYDAEVRTAVLATPGIPEVVSAASAAVLAYLSGPSAGPVTVAVGCAGGRHRAATVALELARLLGALLDGPVQVTAAHRDLGKDVVSR